MRRPRRVPPRRHRPEPPETGDAKPEAGRGRYRGGAPSRRRGAGRPGSPKRSWPSRPQTSAGGGPSRRPQAARRHCAYDCPYALFSARRTPRRKAALTGCSRTFASTRDWAALLAVLPLGMAFGAVHALTPGHGKTVLASYLVGSRLALLRGLGVAAALAVTHVGSAVVLAL